MPADQIFLRCVNFGAKLCICTMQCGRVLFGRKVAIDASMSIYQFLIAVRQKDGEMLTNAEGETTR